MKNMKYTNQKQKDLLRKSTLNKYLVIILD